jgi:hypothetical protein
MTGNYQAWLTTGMLERERLTEQPSYERGAMNSKAGTP